MGIENNKVDKKDVEQTFKKMCDEQGVNYANALYQRKKHPSLTNQEVIDICCKKSVMRLNKDEKEKYFKDKEKPFRVLCLENKLEYSVAYMYKRRHPDMTDEEVIKYYKLQRRLKNKKEKMQRLALLNTLNVETNESVENPYTVEPIETVDNKENV